MIIRDIPRIKYADSGNFFLIAGPCVVEDEQIPFEVARTARGICEELEIPFIFKASYKKANRSKLSSFTGIGDERALKIIHEIGLELDIPTLTDVHTAEEATMASNYVDVLQIPAFLCRQTDLLVAAANTGKPINLKKGQFLSPEAMMFGVEKIHESGNRQVMLTERGSSFGYHDLVVDYRGLYWMKKTGCPVVLDVTHSLQIPNRTSGTAGGHPELIETMASAGIAAGADGIFLETHPNPAKAKSDGENMLDLSQLEGLLWKLVRIRKAIVE